MPSFSEIEYAVDGPVATLTLDRPDRLNAFTPVMAREMVDALDLVDADDAVRALIVTGRGRGYCAGADLGSGGDTFNADRGPAVAKPAGARRYPATEGGW